MTTFKKINSIRSLLFTMAFCLCALSMQAENYYYESVTLENGYVFEGLISEQHPGSDIYITPARIVLRVDKDNIKGDIKKYRRDKKSLSSNETRWLDEHPQFVQEDSIVFCDLQINRDPILHIEKIGGAIDISDSSTPNRFMDFVLFPESIIPIRIEFSHISSIKNHYPSDPEFVNVLSTNKEKTYKGAIIEQKIGEFVIIQQSNKKELKIPLDDITKKMTMPSDSSLDLFEVTPIIETIKCVDGNEYSGLMVSSIYAEEEDKGDTILVYTLKRDTVRINNQDIVSITRSLNEGYVSYDPQHIYVGNRKLDHPDSLSFSNGIEVYPIFVTLLDSRNNLSFSSTNKTEIDNLMLVKAEKKQIEKDKGKDNKKKEKGKAKEELPCFVISAKDFLENSMTVYGDARKGNRFERSYQINENGFYILFNRIKNTVYVLQVK